VRELDQLAAGAQSADGSVIPRVCIVTVDPSGDAVGASLARELRSIGEVELFGAGGPLMAEAGVRLLAETTACSSLGVVAYVSMWRRAGRVNHQLRQEIAELEPNLLVLIDCGAFNIPLARALRRRRAQPVLYYIPPRSWSRRWRVGRLAEVADYIAAPFPWNAEGGDRRVRFVGHPATDLLSALPAPREARRLLGLAPDRLTLGLLPGSRNLEIGVHLPIVLRAARMLQADLPGLQVVLSRARTVPRERLTQALDRASVQDVAVAEGAGTALRASDAALVCLGTATLEGCVLGCPMIGFYRGTRLQGLEYLVKPPRSAFFAMPNILANDGVIPEFIQWDVTSERLAAEASTLLRSPGARRAMSERLTRTAAELGGAGATTRAARAVWDALQGRWDTADQRAAGCRDGVAGPVP
jgi:lipid-A-disaccharide synthase